MCDHGYSIYAQLPGWKSRIRARQGHQLSCEKPLKPVERANDT
jgi:hypothetical protein